MFQWLERELCAVLAILIVATGVALTRAGTTSEVLMTLSILPAAGTIQVNSPNGGESWQIGTSQTIEWLVGAGITDVKIELQRTTGGTWETIAETVTASDGSHSWTVTGSATTTAIIKISDTTNPLITDVSNGVFAITEAVVPPPITPPTSGGGGGVTVRSPFIGNVHPNSFINTTDVILDVTGTNFEYNTIFKLGTSDLRMLWSGNTSHIRLKVPKGFKPGKYVLAVYNSNGTLATWNKQIEVKGMYYNAILLNQSSHRIELVAGQTAEVWTDFVNTGTESWLTYTRNTTRLGTAQKRDRRSVFWRSSWVLLNRPANVQKVGLKGRQIIEPGETGRFTFKVKAPSKAGNYVEYFSPVAEYIQWMDATVSWEIVVTAKPSIPTVSKPVISQPSFSWPSLSLPESPTEFYDRTEQLLRSIGDLFNQLLSGFKNLWCR